MPSISPEPSKSSGRIGTPVPLPPEPAGPGGPGGPGGPWGPSCPGSPSSPTPGSPYNVNDKIVQLKLHPSPHLIQS